MSAGARNGRTPFGPSVAREGWATQRSACIRPSASIEVACETRIVASAPIPRSGSESAPLRPLSLLPDRTASGPRAGIARRLAGLPGVNDLRNADSGAIETASKKTDCTRDSALMNAEIGIVRLRNGAQSGEETWFPAFRMEITRGSPDGLSAPAALCLRTQQATRIKAG
jgi:hypothetical protein